MAMLEFNGGKPITVTATGAAPGTDVLDVGLYFGSMTLLLKLITSTPLTGISFQVTMETSMDPNNDWVSLGTFTAITTAQTVKKETFTGLLRYVRWNVTTLATATNALFTLSGVARNP